MAVKLAFVAAGLGLAWFIGPAQAQINPPQVYKATAVTAPHVKYAPDPEYPVEARQAGVQGTVVLGLIVDTDGIPRNIRVLRSLGYGLDERAVDTVRKWRFNPAKKDGKPVAVEIDVQVNFRLLDGPGSTRPYPIDVTITRANREHLQGDDVAVVQAKLSSGGHVSDITMSCKLTAKKCIELSTGTYAARLRKGHLELLVPSNDHKKVSKAEFSIAAQQ